MRKLLLIFVLGIFLLGSVSALTLNSKNFDEKIGNYGKYEIKNIFGSNLKDITLIENTEQCIGSECYAIKQITLYKEDTLVDDVRFFKDVEGEWVDTNIRDYTFYIKTGGEKIKVDDYETQCGVIGLSPNGTEINECNRVKVGSHFEDAPEWSLLDLDEEYKAGTYEVKLVGHKKPSWKVDWQIKTSGIWTEEWAVWGNISEGDDAEVILNSPADDSISYLNEVKFNATATVTGGATIENMSLWTNESGSWEEYNSTDIFKTLSEQMPNTPSSGLSGTPKTGIKIQSNESVYITGFKTTGDATTGYIQTDYASGILDSASVSGGVVTFSSPVLINASTDYFLLVDSGGGSHNSNYYDGGGSYMPYDMGYINVVNSYTQTGASTTQYNFDVYNVSFELALETTSTQTWNRTITDGIIWNVQACDSDGDCGFATSNFTLKLDTIPPTLDILSPSGTYNYLIEGDAIYFTGYANDSNLDTCWYDYKGTNTTFSCTTETLFNETILQGDYSQNSLTVWANDSVGNKNNEIITWDYKIFENAKDYNLTTIETARESFELNITANSSLTAVALDYNGTEYSLTESSGNYSTSLDIPLNKLQNNSIRWKFTYAGDSIYSDYFYQNVSLLVWTLCNSSYTDDFLNITFKDEEDSSYINASIPTSTFTYYLGTGSVNKSYSYTNNTNNYNYTFCSNVGLRDIKVVPYVQYKQGTTYPQRTWDADEQTYDNETNERILYLLGTADGIYVTFQVINLAQQTINGVVVNATREIGGSDVVVGDGITDAAGTVTFWLNPDFLHTLTFTKSGYDSTTFTVTPTQSSYTVTMGGDVETEEDYTQGILISINPNVDFLDVNTSYDFNYTISSSYWNLDSFAMSLYWGNDTLIDTQSSTASGGGTLQINNINLTTNESEIYLTYNYTVNSTNIVYEKSWRIQGTYGRQFSIFHFFEDFTSYTSVGLFGFNDFTKIILSIFIIIFVSGGASLRYGIRSQAFVTGMIFGVVFLLDVGLGFLPQISFGGRTAINNFPTFITAIILIIVLVMEERR